MPYLRVKLVHSGIPIMGFALAILFQPVISHSQKLPTMPLSSDTAKCNELYETTIRPLFAEKCYGCHSSKVAKPPVGLILDKPGSWFKGGEAGQGVVARNLKKSLIMKALKGLDGFDVMPPSGKLSDKQIAAVEQWIMLGATAPEQKKSDPKKSVISHWAFKPIKVVKPPVAINPMWNKNAIDQFVLAKMHGHSLSANPPIDRRGYIRRATFDLLGLPPTPEEIDLFVKDKSPKAYEKLIDRLLASSRYGEKWGRHWLDVVHYGDTHGYDKDKKRESAWRYRDYVIEAFNSDRPYSQFIKEQIAGDYFFPDDPVGDIATGFLAAGPWDFVGNVELREGTIDREKTRLIDRDDMVSTTVGTFNSLTVHCARCHDHKFDPIPQRDYYKLQAVFAGVERGDRSYLPRSERALAAKIENERIRADKQRLDDLAEASRISTPLMADLVKTIDALDRSIAAMKPNTNPAKSPSNGYHSQIATHQYTTKWVQIDLGQLYPIDTIRIVPARPTDFPDTPGFGFPVRFNIETSPLFKSDPWIPISEHSFEDFVNPGDRAVVINVNGTTCNAIRIEAIKLWRRTNDYVFALGEVQVFSNGKNVALGKPVTAFDSIESGRWAARFLVDGYDSREQLDDPDSPATIPQLMKLFELEIKVIDIIHRREEARQSAMSPELRNRIVSPHGDRDMMANFQFPPKPSTTYSINSRQIRKVTVLNRGEVDQPMTEVGPGALSCLKGLNSDFDFKAGTGEKERRAALADWISDPKNVLTWRSIVNRVWHYHFGKGIVETPNDFGRNGSRPSNPELLDFLANWFMKHGESIKSLHKIIMLSQTYRQSSKVQPAKAKIDTDNTYLWRMNRRRLEAEEIRDSVLCVSGSMDFTMGGPGYESFRFKDDHSPIYDFADLSHALDPKTFRRSVYRFIVRSVPDPFLDSLDAADPNALTPVRNTTLTALQSLALRNDPLIINMSERFASYLNRPPSPLPRQIDMAYRLALGRHPNAREGKVMIGYAKKYGLANTCRLIFNLSEFVFVD